MSKSSIALIRGGEGITEPTDLPEAIAGLLEIDSTVPLRNRGLVPDCKRVFDLDFYLAPELKYYTDAEAYVLAHEKFGLMYEVLKEKIFAAYPLEAQNWDTIRIQRIDAHGAGALWIQGVLKVFAALIGRPYEPTKRDQFIKLARQPKTRGSHKGAIWISMLTDLLASLTELRPDEVGLVCGAFGGTGPSVSAVIGDVLADVKYNVVRVLMVSMPDSFMVNGVTPAETADRLRAVIRVLQPIACYAGLGWNGVFWHFLGGQMRTIGERFSNVVSKQIAYGAAAVITIAGVPLRTDLEERWMVGMTATNRVSDEEAVSRILQGVGRELISLDVVPYNTGSGVRVRVNNPKSLKIWQWELLLPALSAARAGIGRMKLPVDVVVSEGFFGFGRNVEKRSLPVESVPEMDKILARAGVKSVDRLNEAVSFWALTKVEREMMARVRQMPFGEAFAQIRTNFVQTAREILSDLIFPTHANLFPPQSTVLENPAPALFMWGQLNSSADSLADVICGYFAKVDRTAEELERVREAEAKRQQDVMDKVADALARFEEEA